jgi:ribosomal-protein-alanine N-acetyltransferase
VLKAENCIIGSLGFKGQPNDKGEAELGYGMNPDYRRKGFMTEAVAEAMSWALGHDNCTSVIAEVARDNIPSIRVLEKVAMVPYRETNQFTYWRRSRAGQPGREEPPREPAREPCSALISGVVP